MGYRVHCDEDLDQAVRRCARELIDGSIARLEDPADEDVAEAVHDVRKNCKKARGLVRLVRPELGRAYEPANACFRDAARQLSATRDAHALLETFDELVARAEALPKQHATRVRRGLSERAAQATTAVSEQGPSIQSARALLEQARDQVDEWSLPASIKKVSRGVARTYGRGRKALARSRDKPSDERLHDWRKRVKYSWYHVRWLRDAAPGLLGGVVKGFKKLSDLLGEDHDLAVLAEQLSGEPVAFGGQASVDAVLHAARARRDVLQKKAFALGERLYVEKPEAYAERLVAYCQVWRRG